MFFLNTRSTTTHFMPQPQYLAKILLSLFGFATPLALAQDSAAVSTQPEPDEAEVAPMCKTELRLSGAVYDPERPESSFAVFETQGSSGWVYRVGARIGGFELLRVAPRGALLRGPEGECWLQLVGDTTTARARERPAPRSKRPARPKRAKTAKKSEVVVIGSRSN